jgi:hypothetical protein
MRLFAPAAPRQSTIGIFYGATDQAALDAAMAALSFNARIL